MSIKSRSSQGFTLVELIIVIVVIAVLSTIGVVGFNSIGTRAEESKLQSDINGAIKKIAVDTVDSGVLPANADSLPKSEGVTYQYTQGYQPYRGEVYCITATSIKGGVKTYYSDNGSAPREGACPGHDYGTGSPSIPSVVGPQKLNTFVANIKTHAQASGLTVADYSSESSEPAKQANALAANPGLSVQGDYIVDQDKYRYSMYTSPIIDGYAPYTSAVVSLSNTVSVYIYMRPSDGLVLRPPVTEESGNTGDIKEYYTSLYSTYPMAYMPYVASQLDIAVDQLDATTFTDTLADLAGGSIFTPISGEPGGPWVFGLDQATFGEVGDFSSCRIHASNPGQGYVKIDSYSC